MFIPQGGAYILCTWSVEGDSWALPVTSQKQQTCCEHVKPNRAFPGIKHNKIVIKVGLCPCNNANKLFFYQRSNCEREGDNFCWVINVMKLRWVTTFSASLLLATVKGDCIKLTVWVKILFIKTKLWLWECGLMFIT